MAQQPPQVATAKPAKVFFWCSAPNVGFSYPPASGGYDVRVAFKNHFLITEDPAIINYVRKNFIGRKGHFDIKEVNEAQYQRAIAIKEPNPPAPTPPAAPVGSVAATGDVPPATTGMVGSIGGNIGGNDKQ